MDAKPKKIYSELMYGVDKLSDFANMCVLLSDDVTASYDLVESDKSQHNLRSFVRTLFAAIEGMSHSLKAFAMETNPNVFTLGELVMLGEASYILHPDGRVEQKSAKISVSANIVFAFKSISTALSSANPLITSNHEWHLFKKAVKIRDRLTHPKSLEDLMITQEEFYDMATAFRYIVTCYRDVTNTMIGFDYSKINRD